MHIQCQAKVWFVYIWHLSKRDSIQVWGNLCNTRKQFCLTSPRTQTPRNTCTCKLVFREALIFVCTCTFTHFCETPFFCDMSKLLFRTICKFRTVVFPAPTNPPIAADACWFANVVKQSESMARVHFFALLHACTRREARKWRQREGNKRGGYHSLR